MSSLWGRYAVFALCIVAFSCAIWLGWPLWIALVLWGLVCIGVFDLLQTTHSILRNFPVIGHTRWIVEFIRPELRQYLFESETEAAPFSRAQRSLVYQRAKDMVGEHPFGTLLDVYADDYEFIAHSARPIEEPDW